MAHITLIQPPSTVSRLSVTVDAIPPLSLALLAGSLLQAGHQIAIVDGVGGAIHDMHPLGGGIYLHGLALKEIVRRIPTGTDLIGVSAMFTHEWPTVRALLEMIRAAFPDTPIVLGGEHATATCNRILAGDIVDAVVLGEGEYTFVELAGVLKARGGLDSVEGIAFCRKGSVIRTRPRPRISDLDAIPLPAWELVDLSPYLDGGFSFGAGQERTLPVLASRGCPYDCAFCSNKTMWGRRHIPRSPESVVREIAELAERHAVRHVDFYDQTFGGVPGWIEKFCRMMMEKVHGVTWQLPSGTRHEHLTPEFLKLMARSGCTNISFAPESGSRQTLERIGKRLDPDALLVTMREAVMAGINIKANMIVGFPGESAKDVVDTLRYAARMAAAGVHDCSIWAFVPYPGTRLFDELSYSGGIRDMDDEYCRGLMAYSDFSLTPAFDGMPFHGAVRAVRILGEIVFYGYSYSSPRRALGLLGHLASGRSESRLEHAISNLFRRQAWIMKGR